MNRLDLITDSRILFRGVMKATGLLMKYYDEIGQADTKGIPPEKHGRTMAVLACWDFMTYIISPAGYPSKEDLSFLSAMYQTDFTARNFREMIGANKKNLRSLFSFLADIDGTGAMEEPYNMTTFFYEMFRLMGLYYVNLFPDIMKQLQYETIMHELCTTANANPTLPRHLSPARYVQMNIESVTAPEKASEPKTPAEELQNLIGLDSIKKDVIELTRFAQMMEKRRNMGMQAVSASLHLVFTGNPGTGKTTVARILAKLYKEIGILKKGQLVEVDRSDLVAGYVGQTALKTQEKIREAFGGILFIDEAYTLARDSGDFGQEAIDTLLKVMEDNRERFIVIVAGYTQPMKQFIDSNPGLQSRFSKYIEFPDYSEEELMHIFESMCLKYEYYLTSDARNKVKQQINRMVENKPENFANARDVRNMFERIITRQANRVGAMKFITKEEMTGILPEDIIEKTDA